MWTALLRALALACVLGSEPVAMTSYDRALKLALVHEGGWVHHPQDPGGETNRGVTRRVYDAYRRSEGLPVRSVRHITDAEVRAIYKEQYWDRVRADELPAGLDYAVFDYAINSGVSRAVRELQRVLGVQADGVIGVMTLGAARSADPATTVNRLCDRRISFLRRLGHWNTFKRGWTRRVAGVRAAAIGMATPVPAAGMSPSL